MLGWEVWAFVSEEWECEGRVLEEWVVLGFLKFSSDRNLSARFVDALQGMNLSPSFSLEFGLGL